ncbi:MAG: radical SAM protein [bacterium]|nr:radical SAM protein [bacterium]
MSSTDERLKKVADNLTFEHIEYQEKRYGKRYSEYRKRYALAGRQEYAGDFPLYILFEQTFRCNLSCPNCLHGYPGDRKKYDTGVPVMPFALYEKAILECQERGCPSVAMHNCDEPLLVKDIARRIRFARSHGVMDVIMTTNGRLLTRTLAGDICEAGLTHILFSIDAATPETYKKVRKGGLWQQVLNAVSYIAQWKKDNKSPLPVMRASFVRSKHNFREEELFIRKFKDLCDYIDIQSFFSVDGLNRELAVPGKKVIEAGNFVCSEPFRKLIVRANGDVVPCCSVFAYKQVMGNVYKQSLYDIHNGEKMNALRWQLKEKNFNQVCRECVSNLYE